MNVMNGVNEGELDLNLGLSIGGVFKGTAIEKAMVDVKMKTGDFICRSEIPHVFKPNGTGEMTIDTLRKREIHALRRQEAKKKREEKQQRNLSSFSNGKNKICSTDDRVRLQAQEFKCRVIDREAKEKEMNASNELNSKIGENGASSTDSEGKALNLDPNPVSNANLNCVSSQATKRNREKIVSLVRSESKSPNSQQNVIPTRKSNPSPKPHGNQTVCAASACTMMPVQYPFRPLQYIPFTLPYLMPYWSSASSPIPHSDSKVNQDNSVWQPVPCKSFRPFASSNPNPKENSKKQESLDSANDDGKNSKSCVMKQCHSSHASTGSLCTSSSSLSDHQSSSNQGGSTGETRSHSIGSPSPQSQIQDCPKQEHFKNNLSQKIERPANRCVSICAQSNPQKLENALNTNDRPSKEEPKSKPPNACLPQMPCVSTTGNGPNGKTITGFLYRYTKTEVSIVCVCHGSSFTPAEFIKHAGGTDIRHPLKHIVVVPSSFG